MSKKTLFDLRASRKFTLKIGVVAMALVAMTGCKDDGVDQGNPDEPDAPAIEASNGVNGNIVTDPTTLGAMVNNYLAGTENSKSGRAPETRGFSMPTAPTIPVDAKEFDQNMNGGSYKLDKAGEYWLNMNNKSELYINGKGIKINISTSNGKPNKIYILEGSEVIINNEWGIKGVEIYAYAPVTYTKPNELSLTEQAALSLNYGIDNKDLVVTLDNNTALNVDGDVKAKSIKLTNGNFAANSLTVANAEIVNDFTINVAQFIKVTGDKLSINSNGSIYAKCLEVPAGLLDIQNCGEMLIDNYILANDMNVLAGGAKIRMQEQSLVDIKGTLYMPNKGTGFIFAGKESSKVKAGTFKAQAQPNNNVNPPVRTIDDLPGLFNGNVGLKFTTVVDNGGNTVPFGKEVTFTQGGTTILEGEEDIYIPADKNGCRPSDGENGKKDEEPEPVEVIGSTDPHTHPISATCVDLVGNQAFVSWHKRGIGIGSGTNHEHDGIAYWGCIEVLELKDNALDITSYMEFDPEETNDPFDFNHVIYDAKTNSLLTMGDNENKGAIIGKIALDGTRNFGKVTPKEWNGHMLVRALLQPEKGDGKAQGISGNSVVIRENAGKRTLYMTTAGGYQTMEYDTDSLLIIPTDTKKYKVPNVGPYSLTKGSAKHIAINDRYAVTIEYTQRPGDMDVEYDEDDFETALPAAITVWPIDEFPTAYDKRWDVPAFSPVYGKNVIAIDGDLIYSCQGHKGVAVYDMQGNEKARWDIPKAKKGAAANGLCIKGGNLYVAAGAAGVYVLDKTTLTVKKNNAGADLKYTKQGSASANYVKVADDGTVYVAYGRAGVKALRFIGM